ncbi:MAG: riboflavin synthase [Ignavibacterium sp.]
MFTGLIEEIGIIKNKISLGGGIKLIINASKVLDNLNIGDSINISGACQTVVEKNKNSFSVEAVEETLKKTNFAKLRIGDKVNLEKSMKAENMFGGHFVLGHTDTVGKIREIKKLTTSSLINIQFPKEFSKYLINVGSIAVEGISLTIAEIKNDSFTVSIIPHTLKETNLSFKKIGDEVNLEFDVLGKYVEKILSQRK